MFLVSSDFCWTAKPIKCLSAEGGGQGCFCASWMSAAEKESYLKLRSTERGSIQGFSVWASGRRSGIKTISISFCLETQTGGGRRRNKLAPSVIKQHGCFHTEVSVLIISWLRKTKLSAMGEKRTDVEPITHQILPEWKLKKKNMFCDNDMKEKPTKDHDSMLLFYWRRSRIR